MHDQGKSEARCKNAGVVSRGVHIGSCARVPMRFDAEADSEAPARLALARLPPAQLIIFFIYYY